MWQECFKYCLNSFFSYSFEEFEDKLVEIFLVEFRHLCPENSKYSLWLLDRRLIRKSSFPMSHQDFTALTKKQRRNLPDPRDGFIIEKGHPTLVARYSQVKFKTPDHGLDHGLTTNAKGQTPKMEANALALRDSIVNIPNRKEIIWFDNGMYQGSTERGYNSVNIFDKETNTIVVFRKDENGEYNRFTTTYRLTHMEREYLFNSNGNFVTENNLINSEVFPILKNLTNNENKK